VQIPRSFGFATSPTQDLGKAQTPDTAKTTSVGWIISRKLRVTRPVGLRGEHVINYLEWRKKHGGERNTAIHEIKFLGFIMVCGRF
jgi:hypothetical protein